MYAHSSILSRTSTGRGLPVPFLNLLLLLLCSVVLEALTMTCRCDSRERVNTGVVGGITCFSGPVARVHLTRLGELSWDGQQVDSNELTYRIIAHCARDDRAVIIISASASTSLSRMVHVFKLFQRQHVRYLVEIGSVERD